MRIDSFVDYRKRHLKMSQKAMAEKLGITQACISNIERGISKPDITTFAKMAYNLDVSPYMLLYFFTNVREHGNDNSKRGKV